MVKLMIVDTQSEFRNSLAFVLGQKPEISTIYLAEDGKAAIRSLSMEEPEINMILMSIQEKKGRQLGLQYAKFLRRQFSQIKLLVCSVHTTAVMIKEMLDYGVHGFIRKQEPLKHFYQAINSIVDGGTYYSPQVQTMLDAFTEFRERPAGICISEQERELLKYLILAYPASEISKKMNRSQESVHMLIGYLRNRMGVLSTKGLVRMAISHNLV